MKPMKTKYKKLSLFLLVIITTFLIIPFVNINEAAAQSTFKILPECATGAGNCQLNDFVQLFVNLAQWGLKILPYLSLIFVIWAGFNLIMAGGNPEKIQSGKKMLTSVLIGILIILVLAWAWSAFIIYAMTGEMKIFGKPWWGGTPYKNPNTGCCVLRTAGGDHIGCQDNLTENECRELSESLSGSPNNQTFAKQQSCQKELLTTCQVNVDEFAGVACCVPNNPADPNVQCHNADYDSGCINFPNTHYDPDACIMILTCQELGGIGSGCCVTDDSCIWSDDGTCDGDLRPFIFAELETCHDVGICLSGTCVNDNGLCTSGKINCEGHWDTRPLDEMQNTNWCQIGDGCCLTDNSCIEESEAHCTVRTGDPDNWENLACDTIGYCTIGCCVTDSGCTEGRVNCSTGTWFDNFCADVDYCLRGCCIETNGNCYSVDFGYLCPGPNYFSANITVPPGHECNNEVLCNACCVFDDHCEDITAIDCGIRGGDWFLGTCPSPCP